MRACNKSGGMKCWIYGCVHAHAPTAEMGMVVMMILHRHVHLQVEHNRALCSNKVIVNFVVYFLLSDFSQ